MSALSSWMKHSPLSSYCPRDIRGGGGLFEFRASSSHHFLCYFPLFFSIDFAVNSRNSPLPQLPYPKNQQEVIFSFYWGAIHTHWMFLPGKLETFRCGTNPKYKPVDPSAGGFPHLPFVQCWAHPQIMRALFWFLCMEAYTINVSLGSFVSPYTRFVSEITARFL
jgi:hypothetical protein